MVNRKTYLVSVYLLAFLSIFLVATPANSKECDLSPELAGILAQIEEKITSIKGLQAEFVQEKKLAAFRMTIIIEGRIYIKKPAQLIWHVDRPLKYSVLITDKSIRQWDEETNKVQEMSIAGNPVLHTALDQMMVWFDGKYSALLKDYEVCLLQKEPVIIEFKPKETAVAGKFIESVTIELREDKKYLKKINIKENSGDTSKITFKNIVLKPPTNENVFRVGSRDR